MHAIKSYNSSTMPIAYMYAQSMSHLCILYDDGVELV